MREICINNWRTIFRIQYQLTIPYWRQKKEETHCDSRLSMKFRIINEISHYQWNFALSTFHNINKISYYQHFALSMKFRIINISHYQRNFANLKKLNLTQTQSWKIMKIIWEQDQSEKSNKFVIWNTVRAGYPVNIHLDSPWDEDVIAY